MTNVDEMINVMAAYANGEHIEFRDTDVDLTNMNWSYIASPTWNWHKYEYRVTPSKEKPKKFMTNRQLAELMVKGYGEWSFNTEELDFHTEVGYGLLNTDKELDDDILIRPWGSKELYKPTVDIYEEYVSKWNRFFDYTNILDTAIAATDETESDPRPQDCSQSSIIKDYSGCSSVEPNEGEVFRYNGLTLRCEEGGCEGCAFINLPCYDLECSKYGRKHGRKDGMSVHFVDVSKKENTTASEDSSSTVSKEEIVIAPSKKESSRFMTNGQLSELLQKGYGTWTWSDKSIISYAHAGYSYSFDKEDDVVTDKWIRPWGSKKWIEPTLDIYDDYISQWSGAFVQGNAVDTHGMAGELVCDIKDYSFLREKAEPSIGEMFMYNGKLYKCIEGSGCTKCAFKKIPCLGFRCSCSRRDGKNVIFVEC